MDTVYFIRSLIFLVAGLLVIFTPEAVLKFRKWLVKILRIKYNVQPLFIDTKLIRGLRIKLIKIIQTSQKRLL